MDLPKFKKNVKDFLLSEEGKISKQAILTIGGIIGTIAIGNLSVKAGKLHHCKHPYGTNVAHSKCYGHNNGMLVQNGNQIIENIDDAPINTASGSVNFNHQHHYNHGSHSSHGSHGSHSSCCFPAGTKIRMPDNSEKDIQDVNIGEEVLCFDTNESGKAQALVKELENPTREGVYNINSGLLKLTNEHPIYTKKKSGKIGWASVEPEESAEDCPELEIMKLEVGDFIFNESDEWIEVKSLDFEEGEIKTYNLKKVENFNNFYANGFLVHNKGM